MNGRGYLWGADLSEEIAAEFEALDRPMSLYDLDRARIPFVVIERPSALRIEREPMPKALVARRAIARRDAVGLCPRCGKRELREGRRACSECADKAAAAARNRRAAVREVSRYRMPRERPSETHHFSILARCDRKKCAGEPRRECTRCAGEGVYKVGGYIITSLFPALDDKGQPHPGAGQLGEIFLRAGKSGSSEALLDQWARAMSYALQYGAPVDDLFRKFVATNFEPAGATSNKVIPRCSSILDYVARYILMKFGARTAPIDPQPVTEVRP